MIMDNESKIAVGAVFVPPRSGQVLAFYGGRVC